MKKITLLLVLLTTCGLSAQVLNQSANWPNNAWSLSGGFETDPSSFTGDPTTNSATFSYDDDEAGNSSNIHIAVESPTIDLTAANNAGEFWIYADIEYVFMVYQTEFLSLQYWDDDANDWVNWGTPKTTTTNNAPTTNFCSASFFDYGADVLNISNFSSNQLQNFRYRILYDDNGSWGYGICIQSPTIYSQTPPSCPNIDNLSVSYVTASSAEVSWSPGNDETLWEIVVQPQGTGTPTSGTATTENPYEVSDLEDNTAYEVYVRGNCGGGDYSYWIGPVNFNTLSISRVNFIQEDTGIGSYYDMTVVDMNGDFLDDIVYVTSTSVNIHYQLSSGGFSASSYSTSSANFVPDWSMAAADFDANGLTDLLYGDGNGVTFMKAIGDGTPENELTGFTEISGSEYVFSQRSNFADINNDGHLDAFVCHDVEPNVYYINDGSGNLNFIQGGLGDYYSGGNYGSIWIDYDNDRDLDMFIAKCGGETARRTNQMLTNNGDGTFTENASALGLADPMQTWSSTWGDYDNDGDMDVFVGASSGSHKLMRNNGDLTFTDVTSGAGVSGAPTGHENVSYDFDNDGFLDIACNGMILYGKGDLTFEDQDENQLAYKNGSFGDLNNDGFIDTYYNGTIYWNGTTNNNWVKINTVGVGPGGSVNGSNINGIGARVELHTDDGVQIRDVRSGEGFEFMSSLNTHFGLGSQTTINSIVVYWPSGIIDVISNPNINSTITIVEGATLSLEDTINQDLIIYPNPTKDVLNIKSNDGFGESAFYSIFDIAGKRIMNAKIQSEQIDVSHLSTGNYILRVVSGQDIKTQKFIKQ